MQNGKIIPCLRWWPICQWWAHHIIPNTRCYPKQHQSISTNTTYYGLGAWYFYPCSCRLPKPKDHEIVGSAKSMAKQWIFYWTQAAYITLWTSQFSPRPSCNSPPMQVFRPRLLMATLLGVRDTVWTSLSTFKWFLYLWFLYSNTWRLWYCSRHIVIPNTRPNTLGLRLATHGVLYFRIELNLTRYFSV